MDRREFLKTTAAGAASLAAGAAEAAARPNIIFIGGQVSGQVLAFWDILPSLGELAGVPRPASLDGISVLPALLGERRVEHPPLYWEFHERGFSQAVRFGDWKAVRNNPQKPIELYALEADIGEKNDVAAGNAPVAQKAAGLMKSLRVDSPDFPIRK